MSNENTCSKVSPLTELAEMLRDALKCNTTKDNLHTRHMKENEDAKRQVGDVYGDV